jgi:hypothetical protein
MSAQRPSSVHDLRCACSNLLARIVAEGIELRCRRCRRYMVIKVPRDAQEGAALEVRVLSKGGGES